MEMSLQKDVDIIAYIKYRMCDKEIFFGKDTKHVKMLVQKVTQKFFSDSFCDIFFTVIILILWILMLCYLSISVVFIYMFVHFFEQNPVQTSFSMHARHDIIFLFYLFILSKWKYWNIYRWLQIFSIIKN